MKRPFYKNKVLWLGFAASTLTGIAVIVSGMVWDADHINIDKVCKNQFTYPQHIDACNTWFHQDNLFGILVGGLLGVPALLGFLGFGLWILLSFLDAKDK